MHITHDITSWELAVEGLFDPDLWGIDTPGLHEIVYKAIQAAPIDLRKSLARNVYLSGGSTLVPGLGQRLEAELQSMLPASSIVKVHEGKHREHAAFRGAAVVASLENFEELCITQDDWNELGPDSLSKLTEDIMHSEQADGDYSTDEDDEGMMGNPFGSTPHGGGLAAGGVDLGSDSDSD